MTLISRYCELLAMLVSIALADMLIAIPTTGYLVARRLQNQTSGEMSEYKTILQVLTWIPPALALAAVILATLSTKLLSLATSILRVFSIFMLTELKTDEASIAIWISNAVGICQILMDLIASGIGKPTKDGPKSTARKVLLRIGDIALAVTIPLVIISVLMTLNLERFSWQHFALYTVGWEVLLAISYFWTIHETLKSQYGLLVNNGTSRDDKSFNSESDVKDGARPIVLSMPT